MDAPVDHGARVLGGLLQLSAEPAHLRLLQPRVQGGVPEDVAELLAQIAAVVSAVPAPPVRAFAQRHDHADGGFRWRRRWRRWRPSQQRVQQQRVRSALHEPGDHCAAAEQRRRGRMPHRAERAVERSSNVIGSDQPVPRLGARRRAYKPKPEGPCTLMSP